MLNICLFLQYMQGSLSQVIFQFYPCIEHNYSVSLFILYDFCLLLKFFLEGT